MSCSAGPPLKAENNLALAKTHNTPWLKFETPLSQISPPIMPNHNVPLSGKGPGGDNVDGFLTPSDFGEESRSTNSRVSKEEDFGDHEIEFTSKHLSHLKLMDHQRDTNVEIKKKSEIKD